MASIRPSFIGLALLLFLTSNSLAQSPSTLSFQGRLTDNVGNPINNASQSMTFALYEGVTKIWEETQSVAVVDGVYNVLLGAVVPLDTLKFDAQFDLGVKVGADTEITPRTQLASAATARSLPGFHTYRNTNNFIEGVNVVGGHWTNKVASFAIAATIAGGGVDGLWNEALNNYGTIGGGLGNRTAHAATVSGGASNKALGLESAIGGGSLNQAWGHQSSVSGGLLNLAQGDQSTVAGGSQNIAMGSTSFAAGYKARARHHGTFVWNDRSVVIGNDSLLSTADNQFIVRAAGGVGINRAPGNTGIHLKQNTSASTGGMRIEYDTDGDYWETWIDNLNDYNFGFNGALKGYIRDDTGDYVVFSDARLKDDVLPFDSALHQVLQLRPSTYRFKNASDPSARSVGFIAQEVEPLFPELVSEKDGLKGLNYSGLSVVAIKAIQELHTLVQAQQERLQRQEAEINRLSAMVVGR